MIFETERLILKPIARSDIHKLHDIFIDVYVRRYLCDNEIWSLQKVEEMLDENARLLAEEKLGLWFIETKSDREIVGFVCLWYFFGEPQPQVGYALMPAATKKGYATEAATRIIEYAFNDLGFNYLIASCDSPNIESQKVAERLGMKQVEERTINGNPTLFFRLDKY